MVLQLREELKSAQAKANDEVKELRNEAANLKVRHFSVLLEQWIEGYASDRKGETSPRLTGPKPRTENLGGNFAGSEVRISRTGESNTGRKGEYLFYCVGHDADLRNL